MMILRLHYVAVLILSITLFSSPASSAPKTDTVIFQNGDKLTGEVKSLKRGKLNLNTEATGTIGIEWDKIAQVISDQHIQVETNTGTRFFGALVVSNKDGRLVVETSDGPQILDKTRVVTMEPIEDVGLNAVNVDVSFGYNFAKATGVKQGTFGLDADYRTRLRIYSLKSNVITSDSSSQEASQRSDLALQYTRLWGNRWFVNSSLSFNQNDELGLDLRTSIAGGGGRLFIQNNSMVWSAKTNLQFSREDSSSDTDNVDSLELVLSTDFDWFIFEDPELDWSTTLEIIPSLTEKGRVRGNFDTSLKWEIIGDLSWAVSFLSSYDSDPQSTDAENVDYSVNTTLVYEF